METSGIFSLRQLTAVLLTGVMAAGPAARAQTAEPRPPASRPAGLLPTLQVIVLAGDGEVNDIEKKIMAPLVVQVLDLQSRPVEGADVTFRFPLGGATAAFADGQLSRTFRTNADGQTAATGWTANNQAGPVNVRVTAVRGNETGEAVVTMLNGTGGARSRKDAPKRWWNTGWFKALLVAGVAGGAAAGILATRGSEPTISVTPGAPSIGGIGP